MSVAHEGAEVVVNLALGPAGKDQKDGHIDLTPKRCKEFIRWTRREGDRFYVIRTVNGKSCSMMKVCSISREDSELYLGRSGAPVYEEALLRGYCCKGRWALDCESP